MPDFESIQEKVLEDYLEAVKNEIFFQQGLLGITASGFSENNTKVLKGSNSGIAFLSAPQYLTTNFDRVGRRAGGKPPQSKIEDWIRVKGFGQLRSKKTGRFLSVQQLAYLIAKKIETQGTDIYQKKLPGGIKIKTILREQLPKTGRRLAKLYATATIEEINRAIKR